MNLADVNVGSVDQARIARAVGQSSGVEVATSGLSEPCPLSVEADKLSIFLNVYRMSQIGPFRRLQSRAKTSEVEG